MCSTCGIFGWRVANGTDKNRARVAYHESGHLLVAYALQHGPFKAEIFEGDEDYHGYAYKMHGNGFLNEAMFAVAGYLGESWATCEKPVMPAIGLWPARLGAGTDKTCFLSHCSSAVADPRLTASAQDFAWQTAWQILENDNHRLEPLAKKLYDKGILNVQEIVDELGGMAARFPVPWP